MLIRYPGSKERIADAIVRTLPIGRTDTWLWDCARSVDYREPFFGAGAIGFRIMANLPAACPLWLNDIDPGMVALWECVRDCPRDLIDEIAEHVPSVEKYQAWKERLSGDVSRVDRVRLAACKLALHQQSFSGLGLKAGSPIGGWSQGNPKYNIESRWNVAKIAKAIARCHKAMRPFGERLTLTCGDFGAVFDGAQPTTAIYCDPPYYEKGPELYFHSMDDAAHVRLRDLVAATPAWCCVSYDDHPRIRELYAGFECVEIDLKYTIHVRRAATRKNHEVMFLKSAA